ncbi:hypothetical protein D3C73_1392690 [compost metagenome]
MNTTGESFCSFLHNMQTKRFISVCVRTPFGPAFTLVGNAHYHLGCIQMQRYLRFRGSGMLSYIIERFLANAPQPFLHVAGKFVNTAPLRLYQQP